MIRSLRFWILMKLKFNDDELEIQNEIGDSVNWRE